MKPKFEARIEGTELILKDIVGWKQYLLRQQGEVYVVITKKRKDNSRSGNQNRYYWGVVIPLIADYMGDTHDAAHEAMKLKFLIKEGKLITLKGTKDLTTSEFEDYMSRIRVYMSVEHRVYIPQPNEVDYE